VKFSEGTGRLLGDPENYKQLSEPWKRPTNILNLLWNYKMVALHSLYYK
jgi:hypothetical protein